MLVGPIYYCPRRFKYPKPHSKDSSNKCLSSKDWMSSVSTIGPASSRNDVVCHECCYQLLQSRHSQFTSCHHTNHEVPPFIYSSCLACFRRSCCGKRGAWLAGTKERNRPKRERTRTWTSFGTYLLVVRDHQP